MRLIPADPDIETVFGRIRDGSLDLQPDFQRGEVWSQPKQRLLIDSILRGWYVPPVHVVRVDDDQQVVLDGQQRLRAIELFMRNRFAVNGNTEPTNTEIEALHGLRFDQLPPAYRRRFDRFTLRMFELVDYEPDEPSELFFRLNQPATLTEAEKRNAFFGPAREQVRELTHVAEEHGMRAQRIGFSGARFAYEDVVARFVWTLEVNDLNEKLTAARVTARYRSKQPLDPDVLLLAAEALKTVFDQPALDSPAIRLNKATAYSWLLFAARMKALGGSTESGFAEFFKHVETRRNRADTTPGSTEARVFAVFNDRATARVNDVASVVLRDTCLWALRSCDEPAPPKTERLWDAYKLAEDQADAEMRVISVATELGWTTIR